MEQLLVRDDRAPLQFPDDDQGKAAESSGCHPKEGNCWFSRLRSYCVRDLKMQSTLLTSLHSAKEVIIPAREHVRIKLVIRKLTANRGHYLHRYKHKTSLGYLRAYRCALNYRRSFVASHLHDSTQERTSFEVWNRRYGFTTSFICVSDAVSLWRCLLN
jgi:hypothetical protein